MSKFYIFRDDVYIRGDYIYGQYIDAYNKAKSLNQFDEDYIIRRVGNNYSIVENSKECPPFPHVSTKTQGD